MAVLKSCVGESVTKGKNRVKADLVELTITHINAFLILYLIVLGAKVRRIRIVSAAGRKCVRKLAGRIDLAKQDGSHRMSAFLSRKPRFNECRDFSQPVIYRHRSAIVQYYNGFWVDGADGAN